jgi:hypothetical protein
MLKINGWKWKSISMWIDESIWWGMLMAKKLEWKKSSQVRITTDGQSARLSRCQAAIWGQRKDLYYYQTVVGSVDVGRSLWREDGSIIYNCCWSSLVILKSASLDSWRHFTVSNSRLPQPGGPGLRIYIPKEQGGSVIPPGTGFPFHCLLRLAGLRWSYSWSFSQLGPPRKHLL